MISKVVKQGWVGVAVNSKGQSVLLQTTETGDGWCQQARVVLTADEALDLAVELKAAAEEI